MGAHPPSASKRARLAGKDVASRAVATAMILPPSAPGMHAASSGSAHGWHLAMPAEVRLGKVRRTVTA
jgi:hypothetical protein